MMSTDTPGAPSHDDVGPPPVPPGDEAQRSGMSIDNPPDNAPIKDTAADSDADLSDIEGANNNDDDDDDDDFNNLDDNDEVDDDAHDEPYNLRNNRERSYDHRLDHHKMDMANENAKTSYDDPTDNLSDEPNEQPATENSTFTQTDASSDLQDTMNKYKESGSTKDIEKYITDFMISKQERQGGRTVIFKK